jgi:hypothetical protein
MNINESGQNGAPVQVQHASPGSDATCESLVIAEGEDFSFPYGHRRDNRARSVHGYDMAVAKKKIGASMVDSGFGVVAVDSTHKSVLLLAEALIAVRA